MSRIRSNYGDGRRIMRKTMICRQSEPIMSSTFRVPAIAAYINARDMVKNGAAYISCAQMHVAMLLEIK